MKPAVPEGGKRPSPWESLRRRRMRIRAGVRKRLRGARLEAAVKRTVGICWHSMGCLGYPSWTDAARAD